LCFCHNCVLATVWNSHWWKGFDRKPLNIFIFAGLIFAIITPGLSIAQKPLHPVFLYLFWAHVFLHFSLIWAHFVGNLSMLVWISTKTTMIVPDTFHKGPCTVWFLWQPLSILSQNQMVTCVKLVHCKVEGCSRYLYVWN
jgi:hypothetical protein